MGIWCSQGHATQSSAVLLKRLGTISKTGKNAILSTRLLHFMLTSVSTILQLSHASPMNDVIPSNHAVYEDLFDFGNNSSDLETNICIR